MLLRDDEGEPLLLCTPSKANNGVVERLRFPAASDFGLKTRTDPLAADTVAVFVVRPKLPSEAHDRDDGGRAAWPGQSLCG